MASQPGSQAEPNLPERPKDTSQQQLAADSATAAAAAPPSSESSGPSKSALKKAAKEKEKAEKAAKRAQAEAAEKAKADANDTAKHLYGALDYAHPPSHADTFYDGLGQLADAAAEKEEREEEALEGRAVTVEARVYNARVQSAKLAFLVLRMQEHTVQAVVAEGGDQGISRAMVKWCGGINTESYVRVTGVVKRPVEPVKSTSISGVELHVQSLYVVSEAAEKLPVQVKDCTGPPPSSGEAETEAAGAEADEAEADAVNVSLKVRLDHPVLSMRAPAKSAIFRLQSEVTRLFASYMHTHAFTQMHPSYMVGAATEGGSGVFSVSYFDKTAYLTQSPQFFKQWAVAGDLQRVFSIGPVFRAENSNTRRHLTEFTGLDYEMPLRHHYHEALSFGEDLVAYILRQLLTDPYCIQLTSILKHAGYASAGDFLLPPGPIVRITFAEAKTLLRESGHVTAGEEEEDDDDEDADLDPSQEKALGDLIRAKHGTDFFTIDAYPAALRPFYTHPHATNPRLSNSYDFFLRGQEIMSGAQRCHSVPLLERNMRAKGIDPAAEGFRDYVNAFRYGCPPHGGGGIGLNRVVQFFLGLGNVREATLFPRDPQRLGP